MKIKPEHYDYMLTAMREAAKVSNISEQYFIDNKIGKDFAKRYRWDLVYRARLGFWICANIYPYANDDHIDTALRSIILQLKQENLV